MPHANKLNVKDKVKYSKDILEKEAFLSKCPSIYNKAPLYNQVTTSLE